jgi:hypothetical protein
MLRGRAGEPGRKKLYEEPRRALGANMLLFQPFKPIASRTCRNRKGDRADFTGAMHTAAGARPREECEDRPRCANRIAEIKVVTARIIEIDSAFNESQPEQSDIEVEIALRVAGNRGNMMKTSYVHGLLRFKNRCHSGGCAL